MRLFIAGLFSGLSFAPTFFFPCLLGITYLSYQNTKKGNVRGAVLGGFVFGFGHFLTGLYWISIGVSVYIDEFWWAIPFALVGIPIILACFIAATAGVSWLFRNHALYPFIFSVIWVIFEWLRSWIFTGLPWNLIGYAVCFSDMLMQSASIFGIYGISFSLIYILSGIQYFVKYEYMRGYVHLIVSITIIITAVAFGFQNLKKNPTIFSDLTVRIVQPSIPQTAKWDVKEFWKNFNLHLELSNQPAKVDFIIWSEAAMTVPYYYPVIKDKMVELLQKTDAILITGGVSDNGKKEDEFEIYSSIYAMDKHGDIIFNYHKAHLVPFGEYMPFKAVLPVKKLTHGFLDYTEGKQALVEIKKAHIKIRPLICYEAIFPEEVRVSNQLVDLLVNITNDAWYGRSSGPYQHYYLSLMRAIENGLPLIRVANNGLSAVIDPQGRVLKKLNLNQVAYADEKIPLKSPSPTLYSEFGYLMTVILAIITLLLHLLINFSLKNYPFIYKNS